MTEVHGIGADIVEISRIAALREKHGDRFFRIVFTDREAEYCRSRMNADQCLAARFAAKEAVMKALGTGWTNRVAFTGIEIVRAESGRPEIRLHGSTAGQARELGVGRILVSLSHSRDAAIAYAVAEKTPGRNESGT
ncbi:MAG: holo-ACP synthase [Planctomycetota bacterium]|jgi:holo-[acyl-carrier protein] synthase|nr:holo-ACP synthase [Planctomycetota bacterium]